MDDGEDNADRGSSVDDITSVPPKPELVHRQRSEKTKDGESEFACSVCLQLSVLPTTLTCGHTSCRYCLAQWYFSSKKKECPLCKAAYEGHPKINTQLRNLLTRLYPVEMEERQKEADDSTTQSVIAKYDNELSKSGTKKDEMTSFCSGIIVACCIFVVTYLAWYWNSQDTSLLVMKPVLIWNPSDVETWLNEISWASQYAHLAQENNVDGRLLITLDENVLTRLFNITESAHVKALKLMVDDLIDTGVKMPATIWEYKALYPGRCLFLVFGLKDFPRTTILYLWMYFREEMFYPFVIATQEEEEFMPYFNTVNGSDISMNQEPSNRAWFGFLYYTLLMPEYLIGIFAYRMFKHHFFTPIFVLATLTCRLALEILKVKDMIQNRSRRMFFLACKDHAKHMMSAFMFMVLWPIIPSFVCDVFFYCALYVSPIQMLSTLHAKLWLPLRAA